MKQLKTVFKFEFLNYAKSKGFIAITVILVVVMAGVLSWPRIASLFQSGQAAGDAAADREVRNVAVASTEGDAAAYAATFTEAFGDASGGSQYQFTPVDAKEIEGLVDSGAYESGVLVTGPLSYTRYVRNTSMYDFFDSMLNEVMLGGYRYNAMVRGGLSSSEAGAVLSAQVVGETVTTAAGKDGSMNFLYTYILIMMLYMTVVMYGNLVASSVAMEKTTRAMELLITSTKPQSLMFGKVLGAGLAGLSQFVVVLGTAFLFYNFNAGYFGDNPIIRSIFSMPLSLMLYTFLFFILGFFIYAFLYAALASLVSRMEDLGQATMPVILVLVAAFMVVVFSISSGNVDNIALKVCSFIPFTSPMAMFARIAMGEVAGWEVALSVGILIASTIGVGFLASAIYRLGVLLYGTPPKPREVWRMLRMKQ